MLELFGMQNECDDLQRKEHYEGYYPPAYHSLICILIVTYLQKSDEEENDAESEAKDGTTEDHVLYPGQNLELLLIAQVDEGKVHSRVDSCYQYQQGVETRKANKDEVQYEKEQEGEEAHYIKELQGFESFRFFMDDF